MFVGNKNKIDLGTSSFARVMEEGALYVDKSRFIEHFLNEASEVQLVARQRRLGKSLNMDMLRCFLTDADDNRHLFDGLYIQGSPLWEQANSAPVFLFDFKSLKADTYRIAILSMVDKYIDRYISDPSCPGALKRNYDLWYAQKGENPNGLLLLTEAVHAVTGKKSYLFIDEYDKLLFDAADTDRYEETRQHMTALLSAGMKGNLYLEKALLTGVMRISHEGMLSDLNNITTFDVFRDSAYAGDYGLTEEETDELAGVAGFDLAEARDWYNGIKVDGRAIYNTYGVMSMIKNREFDCYWGNSGTIDKIISLLTPTRERALLGLLEPGNTETVDVESRIGPEKLFRENRDEMFYSLLVQSGYLSLEKLRGTKGTVAVPNTELRDVWRRFLLRRALPDDGPAVRLLDNAEDPARLAADVAAFLKPLLEGLSYFDLAPRARKDGKSRVPEIHYHMFLYGVLCMCRDSLGYARLSSNRESGDGRYDVMIEFDDRALVFEVKSAAADEDTDALAGSALRQITEKRYGADTGKPVIAIGLAFRGKDCAAAGRSITTFYHGTKADLSPGDLITPNYHSNYGRGKQANFVYLTATMDAAVWGAELAKGEARERIYIVEPLGDIEDDPNLTDKKFPGNPTKSYRTRQPLKVTGEVQDWEGHTPEVLQSMRDNLERLRMQGMEAINE